MKYDFTTIMDRRGRDALAVDGIGDNAENGRPETPKDGFDFIPMWIADMNFATAPSVTQAIIQRARHPAYGYFQPSDAYFNAIIRWHEKRNGVIGLTRGCIGYENGVLGGVVSAVNVLCSKGDSILLHSPTYVGFTGSLENSGYHMVLSPLKQDGEGTWRMDFADMEQKITAHRIHTAIFCSPHNPTGRTWERGEVEQFMELCRKHDVFVVSDEIWSDIIRPGFRHIPVQSVSQDARDRTIALYAPSKTFNLGGLIGAYHIIYNRYLRERMRKESSLSHYNSMNVLSMHALIGAYSQEGEEWTDELCQTIAENVDFACDYIQRHFQGVGVSKPQSTYMLFLDCAQWCQKHGKTIGELQKAGWNVGVGWQDGRPFHGPCHIRINLALPLSRVQEAFARLDQYVFNARW